MALIVLSIFLAFVVGFVSWRYPAYLKLFFTSALILVVISLLFWKQGVVMITIASLGYLASQVATGKISGSEAIKRSLAIYTLSIVGIFFVVDTAGFFFYDKDSSILSSISSLFNNAGSGNSMGRSLNGFNSIEVSLSPLLLSVVGVALLLGSWIMKKSPLTVAMAIVGGCLAIFIGIPELESWVDKSIDYAPNHSFRPVMKVALAFMGTGLIIRRFKK